MNNTVCQCFRVLKESEDVCPDCGTVFGFGQKEASKRLEDLLIFDTRNASPKLRAILEDRNSEVAFLRKVVEVQ